VLGRQTRRKLTLLLAYWEGPRERQNKRGNYGAKGEQPTAANRKPAARVKQQPVLRD
jgi:hypothetical protein